MGGAGRSATAILSMSNSLDMPKSIDTLMPIAAVGALLGSNKVRLRILNVLGTAQVGRAVATGLGTGISRLSRVKNGAVRQKSFFGGKVQLRVWSSRLTPALNALDVRGLPVAVQASGGQMMESRGKTWHLGTTIVNTSQGRRTITHLQGMSLPGTHYYFDRTLHDKEAVGIIAGHREFEARHLPGYAGEITEVESLVPVLANVKKGLIKSHLCWGGSSKS
jgi:hypothetical protein